MTLPPASIVLLGLAWFAAVNAVVSALSWAMALVLLSSASSPFYRRGPGLLLTVRLLPASASMLFVLTMFVPAHWGFEPRNTGESFGMVFYALAGAGVVLLLRSAGRAVAVARAGRQLRACTQLPRIAAATADIYEVRGVSGVSLAGVLCPRILVGASVRRQLTPAEMEVAVAHEVAHRDAYDNVKRCLMFCAPDMFGASSAARQIEAHWRASAEWLADARAVDGDAGRALNLASALVKVAQLGVASPAGLASPAWSTLNEITPQGPALLEMRVRRLVGGVAPSAPHTFNRRFFAIAALSAAGLFAAGAALAPSLHQFTESLVRLLS